MNDETGSFQEYDPNIFDECGGVRLELIKPNTREKVEWNFEGYYRLHQEKLIRHPERVAARIDEEK